MYVTHFPKASWEVIIGEVFYFVALRSKYLYLIMIMMTINTLTLVMFEDNTPSLGLLQLAYICPNHCCQLINICPS